MKHRFPIVLLMIFVCSVTSVAAVAWRQVVTERFQIIYEPRDEQVAIQIASFADEVYDSLAPMFGAGAPGRIPVVINGRNPESNGFFLPNPYTVVLYVASPYERFLGQRTPDWLRSLLTHELTHYLHLSTPRGIFGALSRVFGPSVSMLDIPLIPSWWTEGLAVWSETENYAGGRGDDPMFSLYWQAPLAQQRMWGIGQGGYSASSKYPLGRQYPTGYLMVDHLVRTYGAETLMEIDRSFRVFPFGGMKLAFRRTLGKDTSTVFSDALSFQLMRMTPSLLSVPAGDVFAEDSEGSRFLPVRTDRGLVGLVSHPSRYGKIVLYASDGSSSELAEIPYLSNLHSFSVSGDGSTAVVVRLHDGTDMSVVPVLSSYTVDLWAIDLDTGRERRILSDVAMFQPALNADGTWLVAVEAVEDRWRLVRVDLASGERAVLYEDERGSVLQPTVSPDGRRVAYVLNIDGTSSLRLLDLVEGGAKTLVPDSNAALGRPVFADADTVLFSSDLGGRYGVYRVSVPDSMDWTDGTEVEQVVGDPVGALAAIPFGDGYLYETAVSSGRALRTFAGVSNVIEWPENGDAAIPSVASPDADSSRIQFASSRYVDIPRLLFWTPIPMMDASAHIAPGVVAAFTSVLRRHSVVVEAGWSVNDAVPLFNADWAYRQGLLSLGAGVKVNTEGKYSVNAHSAYASIGSTLFTHHGLRGLSRGAVFLELKGDWVPSAETGYGTANLQYGHAWMRYAPPAAYFGSDLVQVIAGTMLNATFAEGVDWFDGVLPYGTMEFRKRLSDRNDILALRLSAVAVFPMGTSDASPYLLPEGAPGANGWSLPMASDIKARLSLGWKLPVGLDAPVPYGGIGGAGVEFGASTSAYRLTDGSYAWEQDVYVWSRISAEIVLGSLEGLRPSVTLLYGACTGKFAVSFDLGIGELLSSVHGGSNSPR